MMISKFEKSDLSIRLAEKMDRMDRTWEWFMNIIIGIFIQKVRYLSGRVTNENVRFVIRMSCRILYYSVIVFSAFLLTRDDLTHDWVIDHFNTNMEFVYEYRKHFEEYVVLSFIMLIWNIYVLSSSPSANIFKIFVPSEKGQRPSSLLINVCFIFILLDVWCKNNIQWNWKPLISIIQLLMGSRSIFIIFIKYWIRYSPVGWCQSCCRAESSWSSSHPATFWHNEWLYQLIEIWKDGSLL